MKLDANELLKNKKYDEAINKYKKAINNLIDEMENSANILLEKLPVDILNECKLMLEQFKRIANADRVAAQWLKNNKLDIKDFDTDKSYGKVDVNGKKFKFFVSKCNSGTIEYTILS